MIRLRLCFALGLVLTLAIALPAQAQTTFNVTNNGITSYTINASTNPTLNLVRGQTYTFNINAIGHPFWIKTARLTGTQSAYNDGVTNNGDDSGTITFVVPQSAPATLFYDCQFHISMSGQINVSGNTPVKNETWGRVKARYSR
jgi:hypothetical protein